MQRPAVVFIHGVRSSSALWEPQLTALHAAGYEAVAVDLPGHGELRNERFTLPAAFETIDRAVAAVGGGTGPVVLVGLSLGGYVTLEYSARRPERLSGVVASACTCDPKGKPVRAYRDITHHLFRGIGAAKEVLNRVSPALLPRLSSKAIQVDGAPKPFRPGWDVVTDMLGQLAGRSSIANLRQIDVPILFVNGKRDHMRLEERKYLAAVPTSELVVVPGAGHDVSSEAPEAFNAILLDALADIAAGRQPSPAAAPGRKVRTESRKTMSIA